MKKQKQIRNNELQSVVRQIVNNSHPDKIILFGSGAEKYKDIPNDFDLLIINKMSAPRLRRRAVVLKNVNYNIPLDIIVLTPGELHYLINNDSIFINEILKKGIVLYEKKSVV